MRAEELIARAAVHGLDLTGAAPPKRSGHRRGAPVRKAAARERVRPEWTLQEIGLACAGVPDLQFMAARYAFAGDHSSYWKLWSALHREAVELAEREGWPAQVR